MTRPTMGSAAALLAVCALAGGAEAPLAGSEGPQTPRELFRLFDMDEAFFASFRDEQPLGDDELDRVVRLLFRLRHIEPQTADRWARDIGDLMVAFGKPAEHRGEMFDLSGHVLHVAELPLSPKLAERAETKNLYLCRMQRRGGMAATVLVASVPAAWPRGKPMSEPARVRGVLLKNWPVENNKGSEAVWDRSPLLLAARVAWHPDTLLGSLGMDVGLLDPVRDRVKLTDDDREPFYQLLAAVGRAKTDQLETAAAANLSRLAADLRRKEENLAGNSDQQARVRHTRTLAERGRSDVEPLFNLPQQQRGALVALEGTALRAVKIRVDDSDAVGRFNVRRYYEVELVTGDSHNNPLTVCLRELPPDMPTGQEIHEPVRVAGFFFKSWAYHSRHAARQRSDAHAVPQQLSPLIVARSLHWTPRAAGPADIMSATLAVGLGILAACGVVLLIWKFTRGDRQARRQLAARFELPEGSSLDRLAP